jgi:hypothetical protein
MDPCEYDECIGLGIGAPAPTYLSKESRA